MDSFVSLEPRAELRLLTLSWHDAAAAAAEGEMTRHLFCRRLHPSRPCLSSPSFLSVCALRALARLLASERPRRQQQNSFASSAAASRSLTEKTQQRLAASSSQEKHAGRTTDTIATHSGKTAGIIHWFFVFILLVMNSCARERIQNAPQVKTTALLSSLLPPQRTTCWTNKNNCRPRRARRFHPASALNLGDYFPPLYLKAALWEISYVIV